MRIPSNIKPHFLKDALESIIAMWRSISAPTSHLQMVPEFSEEEAKAKAQ